MVSLLARAVCVRVWFAQFVSECGHTILTLGNIGHCLELLLVNIVRMYVVSNCSSSAID